MKQKSSGFLVLAPAALKKCCGRLVKTFLLLVTDVAVGVQRHVRV